ncbi:unnamed protein product [Schistocephalus solidus]|uniref:Reverse transcriptase domain-containing protein n=1 Tax=Schistocephalus solidus TaxID=70667 RepID=A0A183SNG2_SCHSO|nr:unnamed protein product [Schistocephalus solidus]
MYFTFEGTMYEQIRGTLMGLLLSSFIAKAVLQKLETLVFANYRPTFWTQFVDDTFVIIKRKMIEEFHSILNSVFPDIQFTMEAKINNQLPFLDTAGDRNRPSTGFNHSESFDETESPLPRVNYVGETEKRLQTRVTEHVWAVRRMDPLFLVAEHCANSGQTFAFQNAKILGRGNDRVTRETIEAWHMEPTSINPSRSLPGPPGVAD